MARKSRPDVADSLVPQGTLGKYLRAEQLRAISDEMGRLTRVVDGLMPAWPGGGYFCAVCETTRLGMVRPEAWAETREAIAHTDSCLLARNLGR